MSKTHLIDPSFESKPIGDHLMPHYKCMCGVYRQIHKTTKDVRGDTCKHCRRALIRVMQRRVAEMNERDFRARSTPQDFKQPSVIVRTDL